MRRSLNMSALIVTAMAVSACAPEDVELACLRVDAAEVCLPAAIAAPHPEADRMLFLDGGGWIEIYSIADHPFATLADLAESCPRRDARTIGYEIVDDYDVFYYHLLHQDDGIHRFCEFGGILSIALRRDCGIVYGVANIVFRGYWPEETADVMRKRISEFMRAVVIVEDA